MLTSDLQTLPAPARPWQVRPWQVVQTAARLPLLAAREARLAFRVVRRDLSTTIVPGTLFVVAAHRHLHSGGLADLARDVSGALVYFFLYIYTFCLVNQIAGVEEDRINKPDRPLVRGEITADGAWIRWAVVGVAFLLVGAALGGWRVALCAVGWLVLGLVYNFLGLHRSWWGKNLVFITLGTVLQLVPAWELVGPVNALAWRWIVVVSVVLGVSFHLQDLRDVPGDRAAGRATMPLVIGERATRWFVALSVAVIPFVVHGFLMVGGRDPAVVRSIEVALAVLNAIVAFRVLALRSAAADHRTYQIHTYWFCAVLAAASPILGRDWT